MSVIPAEGTVLERETATPGTFTEIAQVVMIGHVTKTVAAVKKTKLTSTSQEYRPGRIPDNGTVTFRIQYDPNLADHQQLYDDQDDGVEGTYRIKYADGKTTSASVAFNGFILTIEESDKEDE